MMQRTVVVISAGLGVPSSTRMLADQISADVQQRLSAAGADPIIDVIDLRDYATDIANNMVSGYAGPALADVIKRVEAADAMIAVTPTFSASYSGLFKSFFDVLDPKFLDGMPVVFGATGGSSRHSLVLDMAIRPLFSYLRAHTMPTAIYASPEDWGGSGTNTLERRIGQAAAELTTVLMGQQESATGAAGAVLIDHKAKRAQREVSEMTSLPFAELLAQTQRR
ncbi:FMN reductase [Arthrobacter sp. N199823]|uniref:FMN reductase n=1 Tax=Arthrobacter sp. N199823 TaxID=2058895 RepID=UPI0035BE97AA